MRARIGRWFGIPTHIHWSLGVIVAVRLVQTIGQLGLPQPDWVGNPNLVIITLSLVDTWWQTGNIILILLAGLTSIPQDRIDMAAIDGAARLLERHFPGHVPARPGRNELPDQPLLL